MDHIKNQAAAIALLKELFQEMCSSRRMLKPILTEIVKALDDNLFVDADSAEVKALLDLIVKMQSRFSEIDELKSAAASKNVGKLESAIQNMDNKNIVNEMKAVLIRFKDLQCSSTDEGVIESAKKLQRQAHKLFLRADKLPLEEFVNEGQKFKHIVEMINDPSKISSAAYLEIQRAFPDNNLLVFSLMSNTLKVEEPEPPLSSEDIDEPKNSEVQLKAFSKIIKPFKEDLEALLVNESDFVIENAELKKQMTFKSFNNKLRSYVEGSESDFFPVLRNLNNSRVFALNEPNGEDFNGYNYNPIAPSIGAKLFQWGAVSKVYWHELSFYYLNDYGREMLTKMFPPKDGKNSPKKPQRRSMVQYIRRFIFLSIFNKLGIDKKNYQIDGDSSRFWIRTRLVENGNARVYMAMSLMMLEKEYWVEHVCDFISSVERELDNGNELKAVFMITTLDVKSTMLWLRAFKKLGVKNTFAILLEGRKVTYYDIEGDSIAFDDMIRYLHEDEFDTFADYKKKYIKKTRGRGRKKAADADVEPVKAEEVAKKKRVGRSKKVEPKKPEAVQDDIVEEETADVEEVPETIPEEVPETIPEEVLETIPEEKVEEPVVEPEPVANDESIFMLPTELDGKFKVDEFFIKGLVQNAIALFSRGSAARGLLELHVLRLREELKFVSVIDVPEKSLEWFGGLTTLTAVALDDPLMQSERKNVVPLDFCEMFFRRPAPFDGFDADYLKNFFMATFLIKQSYAPDMNGIYELSGRQTQFLSDKSNDALKLCPSIKKLITLFKDFTDKTKLSFASSMHIDHAGLQSRFDAAMNLIEQARGRSFSTLRASSKHPRVKILSRQLYDTDGIIKKMLDLNDTTPDKLLNFCNQFMAEDAPLYEGFRAVDDELFSEQKVGDYLDDVWDSIKVDSHRSENFTGKERAKQINAFIQTLTALMSYAVAKLELDSIGNGSPAPVNEALNLIDGIVEEGNALLRGADINRIGPALLLTFLKQLRALIEEKASTTFYRECLLGSKYIELSSTGLPELDNIGALRYSFACRVFEYEGGLGTLTVEEAVQSAYETALRSYDLGVFEQLVGNYREQLSISDEKIKQIRAAALNQVGRRIEILNREFLHNLELERHYARLLNPDDIDYYLTAVETARAHFSETNNAGLFERFINAINVGISRNAEAYATALRNRSDSINDQSTRAIIERLIENGRLNVAEDYINEGDAMIELSSDGGLDDFLDSYESIFNVCVKNKNEPLEKILASLKRDLKDEQLREFAEAWQNLSSKTFAIPSLLRQLSFDGAVPETVRKQSNNQLEFHASFDGAPTSFTMFNSRLTTEGLDFVYMPYAVTVEQLIDALKKLDRRQCSAVCLLNMALSLAERRKLAQALKLRAELSNIIVIDRVLAVYLTAFEQSERREKLLSAALPFANVNPYVGSSNEIFIGREKELEALSDINGPTFLVGGRGIGKTALLDQLIKIEHKPTEGVYVLKTDGADWDRIRANAIELLKSNDTEKVLLVLDINKTFASIKGTAPEMFIRLREEYAGRFKYIVTAHHDSPLGSDAVKLKPFTPEEASRMTVEPLSLLGLKVTDIGIMRSVWVQANYYPGLLKYCCGKIIEAIADNYERKNFDATKNPPYEFDDEFLRNMLQSHDLHAELNRRLIETLRDEQEDYYYVLMLAIAYSSYDDAKQAVDLYRIKEMCLLADLEDMADMNDEVMELLLEEMNELKLIRRTGDHYELYRSAYRYLFGSNNGQLEALLKDCLKRRLAEAKQ